MQTTEVPATAAGPTVHFRALASWVMYEWAAQPFYTLILTFLFAPYFANAVVGDPTRGQALWGYGAAIAGVLIAIGSPALGALADGRGRRKPWILLFSLVLVSGLASMWLAKPALDAAGIYSVIVALVFVTMAAEFTTVFTNAMMPSLVPPDKLGRLSGTGWAVGYAGGLVSLALMAGLVVTNPTTGKTLFGFDPVLALDAASHEGDRLVGPFAAAWYVVFMIPFFLFVPDVTPRKDAGARRPVLAELMDTIRSLPGHRDMLIFLVARMIYADGLAAIFAFGGIYGGTVFGWGPMELGLFGIILTLTGVIGALIGGVIDDRVGPKTVILTSLVLLLIGAGGILSVDKTHVFFTLDVAEKVTGSGPFSAAGEKVFLAFAMLVGLVAAPVQAASRSLLARLAPREKITQFFGLFAFSGKVTAFMAPLIVAGVTQATGDQRLGMSSIAMFLVTGMVLMLFVRAPKR